MATTTAFLPQDVLVSILVCLPGSDLRRLRRVCKQWRDIISDHTFIRAHMVHKPLRAPTHTIVFFPGSEHGSRELDPRNGGRGFLFDEQWRLTAELTAGRWDHLIGACNGLLCFLEAGQGTIKIVEPFTGESLAVALPAPEASPSGLSLRWSVSSTAYCFGFDATSGRYKIVHHGYLDDSEGPLGEGESVDDEELHVYTVDGGGAGEGGWRRLHVANKVYGVAYGDPWYGDDDGAVYWPTTSGQGGRRRDHDKLVRFDLATEKVTLEMEAGARLGLHAPRPETACFCRPVESTPCIMTYGLHCEWDLWIPEAEEGGGGGCSFPGGCVLLSYGDRVDGGGGLYLRNMGRNLNLGPRKVLFEPSVVRPGSPAPAAPNKRRPGLCKRVWVHPHSVRCSTSALPRHA